MVLIADSRHNISHDTTLLKKPGRISCYFDCSVALASCFYDIIFQKIGKNFKQY